MTSSIWHSDITGLLNGFGPVRPRQEAKLV